MKSKPSTKKRDFTNFDLHEFRNDILSMNLLHKLSSINDPNKKYDLFHDNLSLLLDLHCPLKQVTRKEMKRYKKPWINNSILKKIDDRNALYKNYLETGEYDILAQYRVLRNEINKDIRRSKQIYHKSKINQVRNNLKRLWKEINNIIGKSNYNSLPSIMRDTKNKKVSNNFDIAQAFNTHYSKVAPNLLNDMKQGCNPLSYLNSSQNSFYFKPTDYLEVFKTINGLDENKANGIYQFPTSVFKQVSDLISPSLAHIVNSSVQQGVFPDKLKIAKVTPLFKSGKKEEIQNYRPISILPLFDKVFEKIMHSRIIEYLTKLNLLSPEQFGFQKNRSTSHATLKLANDISSALKNNEMCCTIFLDLAKAFDTVNHSILLGKLEKFGFRDYLLKMVQKLSTRS